MGHRLPPEPPSPETPLLAARELGRRHPDGSRWLFQGIDLELRGGERLALVGPTGSGKSLVLRSLALLDPLDRGVVHWCGQPIPDACVPDYRSRALYLQQRSPVIEGTVEDNLRLPFSLRLRRGRGYPESEAEALLDQLGHDRRWLAQRTANLSGGERQLVALLRALLAAPAVLLLDEPTAALDPQTTDLLERSVDRWHAAAPTRRALLWVSHDASQAARVSQRVLRLAAGRLQEEA